MFKLNLTANSTTVNGKPCDMVKDQKNLSAMMKAALGLTGR